MSDIVTSLKEFLTKEIPNVVGGLRQAMSDPQYMRSAIVSIFSDMWTKFKESGILSSIVEKIKNMLAGARSQAEAARDEGLPLVANARDQVLRKVQEDGMPMVENAQTQFKEAARGMKEHARKALAAVEGPGAEADASAVDKEKEVVEQTVESAPATNADDQ